MVYSREADNYLPTITWPQVSFRENCFVTSAPLSDGIGSQVHARLSIMLFAHDRGLRYVHTPFSRIERMEPGFQGDLPRTWEEFFNLGLGELQIPDVEGLGIPRTMLNPYELHRSAWRDNTLYAVKHCHTYGDSFPERYESILPNFRAKYKCGFKSCTPLFASQNLNIALHVRRGDVVEENGVLRHPHRYTSNSDSLRVLDCVLEGAEKAGRRADVHVFSDGDSAGFQDFADRAISMHVRESTFSAFQHLASADILIMAKSSFSYVAALLSNGIKVYEKFWHKPLPGWIRTEPEKPDFDFSNFTKQMTEALEKKPLSCRTDLVT